jgi:hypothetical protein
LRREELARVRLESEHGSRQAGVRRGRREAGEQRTMTQVYAIEVADGQYSGAVCLPGITSIDEHRGQVRAKKRAIITSFVHRQRLSNSARPSSAGRLLPVLRRDWQ